MSEKLKRLMGKNPNEFGPVAKALIEEPDLNLFCELVEKDDFLFEFVKENIVKRLEKACNSENYLNLLKLMKYYSPTYEQFIVLTLVKYADEDLIDKMLEIFESGSEDEKTYCAKFFSIIQDPLALDYLRENAYNENFDLSSNCASTLGKFNDTESYEDAVNRLNSNDEYEQFAAAKFLINYGNKSAYKNIIETVKKSAMAENIASMLPYLCDLEDIIKNDRINGLYVLNLVINGLGEIIPLANIYNFNLYSIFEDLINTEIDSVSASVLLNAESKFDDLTSDDTYLYDESKEIKSDVYAIKYLLDNLPESLENIAENELNATSMFVFTALQHCTNTAKIRELIKSNNQTVILKALEVLKELDSLEKEDKTDALKQVTNENIKNIINAL